MADRNRCNIAKRPQSDCVYNLGLSTWCGGWILNGLSEREERSTLVSAKGIDCQSTGVQTNSRANGH